MGTPAVADVLKTGAVVWYAPVGETDPDDTSVGYGDDWGGDWERFGYTKEPLKFIYESEEADIEVEEELAPINRFRIKENLTLETVLAELTATYLEVAAGDQDTVVETPAGAAQKAVEDAGLGGVVVIGQHRWGFEGFRLDTDGDEQPLRIFIHKGTAMVNGEIEFSTKSDTYPGIPIQIKALADTTQTAGQKLCMFQRVTAPVTGA
jgi:hypothetical protein